MSPVKKLLLSLVLGSLLLGCGAEAPPVTTGEAAATAAAGADATPRQGNVTEARLLAADSEPGQWMSTGRTYDEQHY
ncbi:MAG: hypothetical protein RLZZ169_2053, partial [Pseudomonadota bacterium]